MMPKSKFQSFPNINGFTITIQELRRPDVCHLLHVKWYTSIKDIKDQIHKLTSIPPSKQEIVSPSRPAYLRNNITLHDLNIDGPGHTLGVSLPVGPTGNRACGGSVIAPVSGIAIDDAGKRLINDVERGFYRSQHPTKTDIFDGTGGVYFMKGYTGSHVAVFKPRDEEQGMPLNPKDHTGNGLDGLRPYFRPGDGYIRELAAYVFDDRNVAGVPTTAIVHCEHPIFKYGSRTAPKLGSLQEFVVSCASFEDLDEKIYSDYEMQKIALFDLRSLNNDRNSANILVVRSSTPLTGQLDRRHHPRSGSELTVSSRGSRSDWDDGDDTSEMFMSFDDEEDNNNAGQLGRKQSATGGLFDGDYLTLVPIDHGYCFPSRLQISEMDWVWFNSPQVARPLHPALKQYLLSIDIDATLLRLRSECKLSEECLFLLRVVHDLLVDGITRNLTLRDIACIVARLNEDEPSPLERAIAIAGENASAIIDMRRHTRDQSDSSIHSGRKIVRDCFKLPTVECVDHVASQDGGVVPSSTTLHSGKSASPMHQYEYVSLPNTPLSVTSDHSLECSNRRFSSPVPIPRGRGGDDEAGCIGRYRGYSVATSGEDQSDDYFALSDNKELSPTNAAELGNKMKKSKSDPAVAPLSIVTDFTDAPSAITTACMSQFSWGHLVEVSAAVVPPISSLEGVTNRYCNISISPATSASPLSPSQQTPTIPKDFSDHGALGTRAGGDASLGKPSRTAVRRRRVSLGRMKTSPSQQDEPETDVDCDGDGENDEDFLNRPVPIPLSRVASFSSLKSTSTQNIKEFPVVTRGPVNTGSEYQRLRLAMAKKTASELVNRELRKKNEIRLT